MPLPSHVRRSGRAPRCWSWDGLLGHSGRRFQILRASALQPPDAIIALKRFDLLRLPSSVDGRQLFWRPQSDAKSSSLAGGCFDVVVVAGRLLDRTVLGLSHRFGQGNAPPGGLGRCTGSAAYGVWGDIWLTPQN